MVEIIIKISTVFAMMGVGFGASKLKWIDGKSQDGLIKILLNVLIPCMLLCSISENEIKQGMAGDTVVMLGASVVYFIVASVAALGLAKICRVKNKTDSGVYQVIFTAINTGFIGFPVTKAIFGDEMLFFMVLHNIILNIYLYGLCPLQYNSGKARQGLIGQTLKKMINPCICSAVLGIILLFCGLNIPVYIKTVIDPIGDSTIPMAMILIGMQLAEGNIATCFKNAQLLLFCFISMFIWPIAVLIMVKYLPITIMVKKILVFASALPPATTISAIAASEGSNYRLAAEGTLITTLMAIGSLPVAAILVNTFI